MEWYLVERSLSAPQNFEREPSLIPAQCTLCQCETARVDHEQSYTLTVVGNTTCVYYGVGGFRYCVAGREKVGGGSGVARDEYECYIAYKYIVNNYTRI